MLKKASPAEQAEIVLRRLEDAVVEVSIEGITPVIIHAWSEKARAGLPGHPDQDKMTKKGIRQPEEEAESCLYRLTDGRPAMPAVAFKAAMVSACRFFEKPSMTEAKLLFFVQGEGVDQLVPLEGDLHLREDTPRNANGSADLRYRYAISPWRATLRVRYIPTSINAASVVALVDAAGRCGIGDWRPSSPKSSTGTFGQWRVAVDES